MNEKPYAIENSSRGLYTLLNKPWHTSCAADSRVLNFLSIRLSGERRSPIDSFPRTVLFFWNDLFFLSHHVEYQEPNRFRGDKQIWVYSAIKTTCALFFFSTCHVIKCFFFENFITVYSKFFDIKRITSLPCCHEILSNNFYFIITCRACCR